MVIAAGRVGPATRAALNVPVGARIDQIRINLERARWVLHGLAHEFVAANIAGQKVFFVRDDEVVMETRAVVANQTFRRISAERACACKPSPCARIDATLPRCWAPAPEMCTMLVRSWKSYTPSGLENRAVAPVDNTWLGPAQ